jgi:hypothetical protein
MCARIPLPAKRPPSWTAFFNAIEAAALPRGNNCMNIFKLTNEGRARVMRNQGQYACIYDPKDKNRAIKPCAWTRTEMLSQ